MTQRLILEDAENTWKGNSKRKLRADDGKVRLRKTGAGPRVSSEGATLRLAHILAGFKKALRGAFCRST